MERQKVKVDIDDDDEKEHKHRETALTQAELTEIRWVLFGKCPNCHAYVKNWAPGPFNAQHYKDLQDEGIDALTGHKSDCDTKYLKSVG